MALRIAIDGRILTDDRVATVHPGVSRYVWNLLRALPRVVDDEEILLLTGPEGESSRFPFAGLAEVGVELVPIRHKIGGIGQKLGLPRRLRELEVGVLHAPHYLTAQRSTCPLVVTLYDAIGARWPETLSASPRAYRTAVSSAVRSADRIVAFSQVARDELASQFEASKQSVAIIPAAIDVDLQPTDDEATGEARERLKLPNNYVLHLGTNRPHDNLVQLVDVWAETRKAEGVNRKGESPWYLVLAGRHDGRFPEVRQRVRKLGLDDVRFLGEVAESDLAALYSGAELFVLPSLWEGFNMPVLEAMACGTAVACSRTSGLPAVAAMAAAYFDPEDAASMTTTLVRLLKNGGYRKTLAERGAQRAAQFSWQKTAQQTLKVYRQVAG